jgi:hypothetical protein
VHLKEFIAQACLDHAIGQRNRARSSPSGLTLGTP